jgi:hypothetical protein
LTFVPMANLVPMTFSGGYVPVNRANPPKTYGGGPLTFSGVDAP